MAKKTKANEEARDENSVETTPAEDTQVGAEVAPVEVPYSKTDSDGKSPDSYTPTSGGNILVYSKWPGTLRYDTPYGTCRILGLQERKILGAPYMSSEIPVECWNYVAKVYGNTKLFKNHFIFAAKDAKSGDAHAKELANEKTGVEPLQQGKVGIGIKTLNKD